MTTNTAIFTNSSNTYGNNSGNTIIETNDLHVSRQLQLSTDNTKNVVSVASDSIFIRFENWFVSILEPLFGPRPTSNIDTVTYGNSNKKTTIVNSDTGTVINTTCENSGQKSTIVDGVHGTIIKSINGDTDTSVYKERKIDSPIIKFLIEKPAKTNYSIIKYVIGLAAGVCILTYGFSCLSIDKKEHITGCLDAIKTSIIKNITLVAAVALIGTYCYLDRK